jgi:uncharacterized integral membrane protein
MFTLIFLLFVIIIVAIFSVQNASPVTITFFFWKFEASLAIIVFLAALCGLVAGLIVSSLMKVKTSKREKEETSPPASE